MAQLDRQVLLLDSARFDHNRRAHFLRRVEQYYEGLRQSAAPELRGPLAIASQVIEYMRGQLKP